MSELKIRPLEPISQWLEYHLETTMLEPPLFRARLRPIDIFTFAESADGSGRLTLSKAVLDACVEAVVDWDLTINGQRIEPTNEAKRIYLSQLIAEPVLNREGSLVLGIAIIADARNRELFLKN